MNALRIIIAMSLLSLLSGCLSRQAKPQLLIQPILDRVVPADFHGDGEFGERGQYLTLEIKAGGLRRTDAGHWTWSWLEYRRIVNVPLFSGVPYKQEGWIRLGPPKA